MNRSTLLGLLCTALLAFAAATSAATDPASRNPVPPPPGTDPQINHILSAMNTASTWGHPDLFGEFAGMRLYSGGHYKAAIKYFKSGARYADKLSQLSIGLMYENGQGVEKDPVTACAWLALAAERKYPGFVATRNRVCEALTATQHDQAVAVLDKLLPVYGDKVAKKRMVGALRLARTEMTGSRLGFDSGISQLRASSHCGGPTIYVGGVAVPQAGCGSPDFYAPSRWDPKKYFAARDAQWSGTVTVGAPEDPRPKKTGTPGSRAAQPASASSANQ